MCVCIYITENRTANNNLYINIYIYIYIYNTAIFSTYIMSYWRYIPLDVYNLKMNIWQRRNYGKGF